MKRLAFACFALAFASAIDATAADSQSGYTPPKGFVPDAVTAQAIARAVLIPIYGAEHIKGEEPLMATREGDVWTINGTLHCGAAKSSECVGGTARVRLSAKDGRILFVIHYQ
jgi:hypothetical protein